MAKGFLYMPIFRLRTEEKKVLHSRHFGQHSYPCVEIVKATPQKEREPKPPKKADKKKKEKPKKTFADIHLPILEAINASKVFVDLPVHFNDTARVNSEVLKFMRSVVNNRASRTEAMLSLSSLSERIIPVISSYFNKTTERNSIVLQEDDLRPAYSVLAFRTFPADFGRDFPQIEKVIKAGDYLIFDINEMDIDPTDPDLIQPKLEELRKKIKCHIVIVKSVVVNAIKNNTLENGKLVPQITNDLIANYKTLYGTAFGDYAGIKKDPITKGGGISPGFIFYDPVKPGYYGYRGDVYVVKGKKTGDLKDFETIIVPEVVKSASIRRMRSSGLPYLDIRNRGWQLIKLIEAGSEPGKSQGKFKRISMEHYIHCIETDITAGNIT